MVVNCEKNWNVNVRVGFFSTNQCYSMIVNLRESKRILAAKAVLLYECEIGGAGR